MTAAPVLQIDGLDFAYAARTLFNNFSADFGAGLTWVRGPNGSGKSSLLKLIAGALRPAAGRLAVHGIEAAAAPRDYRREVFWCGPGALAFEHLRPAEFFGFMQGLYPRFDVRAVEAHVQGFGLQSHMGLRAAALSSGTQRKVWVAAALAAGAAVVLMDEPLDALDAASRTYLHGALGACAKDAARAWIVVSHESLGAEADAHARVLDLSPQ